MEKENNIFGIRAVMEAIESGASVNKILIHKEARSPLMKTLLNLINSKNISYNFVPAERFHKFANQNHQGVVASIAPISFVSIDELIENTDLESNKALFLMLDGISDTRNFGAIIRTAECVGANGIIIAQVGSAPINGDTIKTSAGAVFNIPICRVNHLKDAVMYLQSCDIDIVACTEKTQQNVYDINLNKNIGVIMGAEDRGINLSILKMVNHKAKLPMYGVISSLNVSVACGAFLYEIIRQRL
ncbi:MAG: 23S rRNA (guanosine(2251)-2'-O)-methyltransferase RlmB [Bacteroidota bacterium]|nr:23S rRNA (guanosine(2251)-2'-O)-methyltransferase RlmB [Bacteroidota bacterium]